MGVIRTGSRFGVAPRWHEQAVPDDVNARDDRTFGNQRKGDRSGRTPERGIRAAADVYSKERPEAVLTTLNQVVDQLKLLLEEMEIDGRGGAGGSASLSAGKAIGKFGPETGLKGAVAVLNASSVDESVKVKVVSKPWNGLQIECRIANGRLDLTLTDGNAARRAILHQQSPDLARKLADQLGTFATITVRHAN